MKRLPTAALLLLLCAGIVHSQPAKQVFVWRNTTRSMLQASAPLVVDDTVNFRVRCLDRLPLLMSTGDSLFFESTLTATDGLVHSTEVHFRTSSGPESLHLEMTAPYTACKIDDRIAHQVTLGHPHPNPARDLINVEVEGYEPGAILQLYSLSAGVICSEPVMDHREFSFSTAGLPKGLYFISLFAGKALRGVSMVTIAQ